MDVVSCLQGGQQWFDAGQHAVSSAAALPDLVSEDRKVARVKERMRVGSIGQSREHKSTHREPLS
jgi:hypothetical protein